MSTTVSILARLVSLVHALLVLFCTTGWLSNRKEILLIHLVTIVTIIVHWVLGTNVCVLTILEKWIRKSNTNCFICEIIDPIFQIGDTQASKIIIILSLVISVLSFIRLVTLKSGGESVKSQP